jgi:hypothetical protein
MATGHSALKESQATNFILPFVIPYSRPAGRMKENVTLK